MRSFVPALLLLASFSSTAEAEAVGCGAIPSATDLLGDGIDLDTIYQRSQELASSCSEDASALELLGDALRLRGELEEAESALRKATRLAPGSPLPLVKLALVAREKGALDEAEILADAAYALANDAEEEDELRELLRPRQQESDEYSFKDAESLTSGLMIGAKSIRPKAIAPDYRSDYFIGSKGLGVNLNILFEVGTSHPLPESLAQLDELGRALASARVDEQYLIEGHASSEGAADFNEALSDARAEAVARYLSAQHGVPAALIEWVGRGIAYPVMENGVENRYKSRRVTVLRLFDE